MFDGSTVLVICKLITAIAPQSLCIAQADIALHKRWTSQSLLFTFFIFFLCCFIRNRPLWRNIFPLVRARERLLSPAGSLSDIDCGTFFEAKPESDSSFRSNPEHHWFKIIQGVLEIISVCLTVLLPFNKRIPKRKIKTRNTWMKITCPCW